MELRYTTPNRTNSWHDYGKQQENRGFKRLIQRRESALFGLEHKASIDRNRVALGR
ncbi:MAG: hypothetical protein ACI8S3_000884 [Alphaproteobacteria bacterium]|jgi:hypothetical protein